MTFCSPDAAHPDNHAAMHVLLAFWLLGVSDSKVLPLAHSEQFLTRVCLRQQPCFCFIIWVYTNPEENKTNNISRFKNCEYFWYHILNHS